MITLLNEKKIKEEPEDNYYNFHLLAGQVIQIPITLRAFFLQKKKNE